jgi:hypothetical protein
MSTTRWAARIVGGIADDVRRDLADSLALAIELHFGLTVTAAEAFDIRGAGGWCDGVSVIDSGLILYRPTPSRRENFTLMHELGHHLVAQDIDCLSWLADQPEPARALEQLCDQIAADLLVHPADVAAALAGGPPDAAAAVALFAATEASRSACAIALTRKLPCDGFVVLIEEGGDEVFFAARARDTRPYAWRGDSLPAGHPLRQTPPPAHALAWWPDPTGRERREYFMSCTSAGGWRIAVFAENNLFGVPGFHIPQVVQQDRGYDGSITCPCGNSGKTRWWPCARCGVPQCPRCGDCQCSREDRTRIPCSVCFNSVLPHLLIDGVCIDCR